MTKEITSLQAMRHPTVVATINVLSETTQRLQDEIDELKAALAQPEQEPVLWGVITPTGKFSPYAYWSKKDAERIASASHAGSVVAPLYADAPQRPWVGLTDEERGRVYADWRWSDGRTSNLALCESIEAKLKEKNT